MTVFRLMAASALAALSLGSAGAQTLVPFNNPALPFSFSRPQGWSGIELDEKTTAGSAIKGITMLSGKTPPATIVRLMYVPTAGKTIKLADQFSGFESGLKMTGQNAATQSSREVSYGGLSGMEREYLLTKGSNSVKMRVWFGQDQKNLYSFQLTDTPARYGAASTLWSQMLATLKFK